MLNEPYKVQKRKMMSYEETLHCKFERQMSVGGIVLQFWFRIITYNIFAYSCRQFFILSNATAIVGEHQLCLVKQIPKVCY